MDEHPISIQNVTEVTGLDSTGHTRPEVKYTFKVGQHGPFTETFPKHNLDPAAVNAKLLEFAAKLKQTLGATY